MSNTELTYSTFDKSKTLTCTPTVPQGLFPNCIFGVKELSTVADYRGVAASRVQNAAQRLGRAPEIVDAEGFCSTILAAAYSEENDAVVYVESRSRAYGARTKVSSRVHLISSQLGHRSTNLKSTDPTYGCEVYFVNWMGDKVVLVYREKHDTFVSRIGYRWPPYFEAIGPEWKLLGKTLYSKSLKSGYVDRYEIPSLKPLAPLSLLDFKVMGLSLDDGWG